VSKKVGAGSLVRCTTVRLKRKWLLSRVELRHPPYNLHRGSPVGTRFAPLFRFMAGITNRPKQAEDENQQRVEQRKDELPDVENVNRPRKDHPMNKDRAQDMASRDRISETGVGLGPDHKGH